MNEISFANCKFSGVVQTLLWIIHLKYYEVIWPLYVGWWFTLEFLDRLCLIAAAIRVIRATQNALFVDKEAEVSYESK